MIPRRALALGLLLATGASMALTGVPTAAAELSEADRASWVERLDAAQARVVEARAGLVRAKAALRDQRQRRYPRGSGRRDLAAALTRAQGELEEAERALPELLEEARRVGLPPGALRRYDAESDQ